MNREAHSQRTLVTDLEALPELATAARKRVDHARPRRQYAPRIDVHMSQLIGETAPKGLSARSLRSPAPGHAMTRRQRVAAMLIWASCWACAGCTVREGANPSPRCETSADCPADLACYRDFCVPGLNLPEDSAAGELPAPMDSGLIEPRTDAGPAGPLGVDGGVLSTNPLTSPFNPSMDASVTAVAGSAPAPSGRCSRDALRQRADAYITAMSTGDLGTIRRHPSLRYTENGQTVLLGLGLWLNRPKAEFVRHALDEVNCSSVAVAVLSGNTGRVIFGVRLRYLEEQLFEIETQVVQLNLQSFNPAGIIPIGPDPWAEPVPLATRMSREGLNQLVANYFDSVSAPSLLPASDPGCRRRQNGALMAEQGSCAIAPGTTAFTEKRYPVIDETNGIVTAVVVSDQFLGRYVGMYLLKVSGGLVQNIDVVGGAAVFSSGW
jgi:hypothetical protein